MCEEVAVPTVPIYLISGERAKPVAKKLREVFDAVAVAPQLNLSSVLPSLPHQKIHPIIFLAICLKRRQNQDPSEHYLMPCFVTLCSITLCFVFCLLGALVWLSAQVRVTSWKDSCQKSPVMRRLGR